jgi:uncharacterized membrane protein
VKHPIHPIVVHLPLGLWPAVVLFDLLSRADIGGNTVVRLSFWAILLGLVAALIAIPTGLIDWLRIKKEKPARRIGLYHMGLNVLVVAIFIINAKIRVQSFRFDTEVDSRALALSIAGAVLLVGSAYLGGLMVYDQGISVARHSKKKWRAVAESAGANLPREK